MRHETYLATHPNPKPIQTLKFYPNPTLGEKIDFFMSHSWHDDATAKWKALTLFVQHFMFKHRREPTFWLDKVKSVPYKFTI